MSAHQRVGAVGGGVVVGGPGVNFKFKTDWILFDGEKLANESVCFLQ